MKLRKVFLIAAMLFALGIGVNTAVWAAQTLSPPTHEAPANGATGLSTTVTLWWTSAGQGATYALQVATDPGFNSIFFTQHNLTERAYTLFQLLSQNTTYYWRVNTTINGQTSAWSEGWGFTTTNATIPAAPVLTSPAQNAVNVPASPTLEWEAVAGATSYHLQIMELNVVGNPVFTIHEHWSISTNSYEPGNLPSQNQYADPGSYQWRVRARNAAGLGAWSEVRTFTIDPGPIPPPNLRAPADGAVNQPTSVTLQWWAASAGSLAATYHLQVSTDPAFASTIVDAAGLGFFTQSYNLSGLSTNTTYYWRVSASTPSRPSGGWSTWSFTTAP